MRAPGEPLFWEERLPRFGEPTAAHRAIEAGRLPPAAAAYLIKAVYWHNQQQMLLADDGGPRNQPNIYRLMLEGI